MQKISIKLSFGEANTVPVKEAEEEVTNLLVKKKIYQHPQTSLSPEPAPCTMFPIKPSCLLWSTKHGYLD